MSEASRPCPACTGALRPVLLGGFAACACAACGGAWLPGHHLETTLDARVPDGTWAAPTLGDALQVDTPGNPRTCPDCGSALEARRWRETPPPPIDPLPDTTDGTVIDRCPARCGVWVDAGEIDRIVETRLAVLAGIPARGLLRAMAAEVRHAAEGETPWALALADLGDLLRLLGRRAFVDSSVASTLAGIGGTHG
jgi:Zn-finger nucleic acid-binding protein